MSAPRLSPALATKLRPPVSPSSHVIRAALCDRVAKAPSVRLIVVQAPAGFGKTTAMAQFRARLEGDGVDTAWLTLDAADNDATRFLSCLGAAVLELESHRHASRAPLEALESLSSRTAPFVVFIDDFEVIQEPAVLALVRDIVDRLPRGGRIVIGSRGAPEIGLARLRAHGQLLEVEADALRFSFDETKEYLRLRGQRDLASASLASLHDKTEGWITALWLASTSLEREGPGSDFVERFSGSNRAIADYLAEDVLASQSPEVRDFLMRTSVLRQFDASLCRALLPGMDTERILEKLHERNLFLVALSESERTYRYHALFADFLRTRLAREHPDEIPRLHLAASQWYAARNRRVAAIDHAIESGDSHHSLALLEQHAQQLLEEGRMRLLARWFKAIPPHDLQKRPLLQAQSVWASLFTHGPWQAAEELERSGCRQSGDPEVMAHVNAQWPLLLAMQDRYAEAYEAGQAGLALLPTSNAFADCVLCNAMAHVFSVMGRIGEARRLIDSARRAQADSTFIRMYAESVEGMLDLQAGRLREATARFRIAVSATHRSSYNYISGNAWAGMLYAIALYEANDFDAAERLVNVYLPLVCDVGLPDLMIGGHVIRARIAAHRGDTEQAFETLTALEYLGHHRKLPRVVASAKLERGRMLLLQGNARASKEELDRADDPGVWERVRQQWLPAHELDYMAQARLRWEIHFGDARGALPLLEQEIAEAQSQYRDRRVMILRVLKSLALQRSGEPARATETIAGVLQQASQEHFTRLLLDEGEAVARLVHGFHAVLQETTARRSNPVLIEYVQRLIEVSGRLSAPSAAPTGADQVMQPLSRKEIAVLRLAAEGCSNSAMAERLALSDSTVRTHLRNINTKLDARSRSEAVAIARRLDLIR